MSNRDRDQSDGRSLLCRVMAYLTINNRQEAHDIVKDKLRFSARVEMIQRRTT